MLALGEAVVDPDFELRQVPSRSPGSRVWLLVAAAAVSLGHQEEDHEADDHKQDETDEYEGEDGHARSLAPPLAMWTSGPWGRRRNLVPIPREYFSSGQEGG